MTKDHIDLPAVQYQTELPIRSVKRRMEGKGGIGGGEVRRVHIIYFLSRMGRIEHPHLIRVHHLSRNGVHLRDVKRWLSELRGKDMPDSFAWSYKRRYKTGYVWQDLLDDDLISPISDNEYVLKGSEISSISSISYDLCLDEKKVSIQKTETPSSNVTQPENPDLKSEISNNKEIHHQIDVDSGPLETSTSTASEDSTRNNSVSTPDQVDEQNLKITTSTTSEIEELSDDQIGIFEEKLKKNDEEQVMENKKSSSASSSSSSTSSSSSNSSTFNKSKSYSSGAAKVLRNLLNCRAVETDDSAMMMINKSNSSEICRLESSAFGGSDRVSCGPWNPQFKASRSYSGEKKSSEFGTQKKVSAAFKPVAEPHCSQCGKGFKPEKLHSHMKSCRGLKNLAKSRSVTATANFGADAGVAADLKYSSQTY